MKQRVLTAVVGLSLFFVIMFFFDTYIFNIAIAGVVVLTVHELLLAYHLAEHKLLTFISCIFAGATPLITSMENRLYNVVSIIAFVGILFAIALKQHNKIDFEKIAFAFFIAIVFPYAFTSLIYIRDQFGFYQGLFYTFLIFACAWGSDTGAYFIGKSFGKKKLAPEISPHKTVEGLVGGLFACILFVAGLTTIYYFVMKSMNITVEVNYIYLAIVSIIGSLIGVMGDLSASLIKRQCKIKDFGTIMPGHGGVLDRFDSVIFIAPFVFVVLQIIELVS